MYIHDMYFIKILAVVGERIEMKTTSCEQYIHIIIHILCNIMLIMRRWQCYNMTHSERKMSCEYAISCLLHLEVNAAISYI